ncbi:Methyltransferase [Candidatus Rhodobacter oscarellae]|uniref:Methyltransferase n=1 Tax=Candidatus Rhodobacter oscarellae TaxID=1675527 RepID=A0A0J9H157_9RHOB|nr:RNA methyltransferase [Candidatus Rhodobacter lobularis]KMW59473.1 Methyltransferase [Candidatus Rhodobacter lobularis]
MSVLFDIFLVVPPGLEAHLAEEARAGGFAVQSVDPGGVTVQGDWTEVWRANLQLRGATRVLVRLAEFRAMHLAQLDKRARRLAWSDWLRPGTPVEVEATCRKSKIYHNRAASERVQNAITEAIGSGDGDPELTVKLRIEDDMVTISLDSSGDALHRRGHKLRLNKAPMRENLAALFLRAAGFDGTMPLYDPMCGSGTFPIEAAEIAAGLYPGRSRAFAFQQLASYAPEAFERMKRRLAPVPPARFFGSDRDTGAVKMSQENAERAGVSHLAAFHHAAISDAKPPTDQPGLVIVNAPYGGRIGNKKPLFGLYGAFGQVMKERFQGWRVALITSDGGLAKASGLPFAPPGPVVDHGGIGIRLWQTKAL